MYIEYLTAWVDCVYVHVSPSVSYITSVLPYIKGNYNSILTVAANIVAFDGEPMYTVHQLRKYPGTRVIPICQSIAGVRMVDGSGFCGCIQI